MSSILFFFPVILIFFKIQLGNALFMFQGIRNSISSQRKYLTSIKVMIVACSILLTACASKPGISSAVSWDALKGWQNDDHSEAIIPLLAQCPKLVKKYPKWQVICSTAQTIEPNNNAKAKLFIQQNFQPHRVVGNKNSTTGLITGYFEPLLKGSYTKTARFNYPLYKKPKNLLRVSSTNNLLEVKNNKARGRSLKGNIIPFYSRAQIDGPKKPLKGQELLWVDNSDDAFFLHIQGSGLVELPNGEIVGVAYADQNGHPYRAIGRDLVGMQAIAKEDISLQSIKTWLTDNPVKGIDLKNKNPSYIFFNLRKDVEKGPRGSLNVPLTAERSVAVDRRIIPLGSPIWLSTTLPGTDESYRRLVFAQDTGGAINGPIRADIFFGRGARAKELAGTMKQTGSIYVLKIK
ncbi:MAG: membrane-bound lytic murein transglycosylase A [Oceanospirillaceae bacterium]|jgi:membrane-bound lytic murein transglycosylase A